METLKHQPQCSLMGYSQFLCHPTPPIHTLPLSKISSSVYERGSVDFRRLSFGSSLQLDGLDTQLNSPLNLRQDLSCLHLGATRPRNYCLQFAVQTVFVVICEPHVQVWSLGSFMPSLSDPHRRFHSCLWVSAYTPQQLHPLHPPHQPAVSL